MNNWEIRKKEYSYDIVSNGVVVGTVYNNKDAYLMASAPELYEAAKMLEDLMTKWTDDFSMKAKSIPADLLASDMIEKFRKAIAKAESKS